MELVKRISEWEGRREVLLGQLPIRIQERYAITVFTWSLR
jgi:hypothetical protein